MRLDLPTLLLVVAGALVALNLLTYMIFAHDKSQARKGGWRVSEGKLWMLAFLGGWPAAKIAQRRLRHKTRKMPFRALLNMIPGLWLVGIAAWMWWSGGAV